MAPYFINGREAQGEDFAEAIEALPNSAEYYPAEVSIGIPDNRTLTICNWPGGHFVIIERGPEWRSTPLTKEQVKAVVASFLNAEEWRKGLQWELKGVATKNDRRRMLAIFLFASFFIGLAMWHSGLSNHGAHHPPWPERAVMPKDVLGTWHYRGAAPWIVCDITFNTNGTYSLIHRGPKTASTNAGRWEVAPGDAGVYLSPFFASSTWGNGAIDKADVVQWWVTSVSSNAAAPFGGDSFDPRRWAVLSTARLEPSPVASAVGRVWGLPAMVAVLATVLFMIAGLLCWKAWTGPRPPKQDWSSGTSMASAVLPQIEQLRSGRVSGATLSTRPMPARKRLIARARRLVAQFAYFRKPENSVADDDHTE